MRFQIHIPDDLVTALYALAERENRWPKQQAEWLLKQALEQFSVATTPKPQDREAHYATAS